MKIKQLTAPQLATALGLAPPPVLVDCRELSEWNHCRIAGARHLPMSEIQTRFAELDPNVELIVYCHHGMRSQQVAAFLVRTGVRGRRESAGWDRRLVAPGGPDRAALLTSILLHCLELD